MNITKMISGMTDEQVQQVQEKILDRIYNHVAFSEGRNRNNRRYQETVSVMLARHGVNGSVYLIDADLAQIYSDCFKDECGCRPGPASYQMAHDYMAHLRTKQSDC